MINRREFLETVAAVVPALGWQAPSANEWGAPVFDLHFHLRPQPAANLAHLDGAGVTKANLLTRGAALEQVKGLQAAAPGRFTWFNSYDVTKPDAEQVLTQSVKDGAQGFGELKFHVAADGPELRRLYALAADLRVPLLIHFQEVDHFPKEGTWSTGYAKTFESILKAYPRTTFIGHADAFWANVSADYRNEAAYPTGPIKRGGVTDRLIGDLAAYLRRADAAGTLKVRHPRQAADLFLSMFLGDGHIRGLLMLDTPDARENRALLREAVRVFMAAYAKAA